MTDYKSFFKGKKITVMGLGLLGRGLGYTKFLAECGADLIVTDLKTKEQLATSIKALSKYKNIKFTLGEHKIEDFRGRDIIMKMAGVPKDSVYIKEAIKDGASIEMDVSLFARLQKLCFKHCGQAKCAPEVMIVGITGTKGKSMTTALIYEILKQNIKDRNVYLGGNVRGVATLPLLKKIKPGDILVCELDSWQLQGFGEARISPHISVFTSFMPDHMNYYKDSMKDYFDDKALIFQNQKGPARNAFSIADAGGGDFLVTNKDVLKLIKQKPKSKIILADKKTVADFDFIVPGEHQKQNLAYAVAVAEILGIPKSAIKRTVKKFKGVEGRLQFLRNYKGIKIYNDNNATMPEATIAGIEALSLPKDGLLGNHKSDLWERNIVLICGGADKKVDLTNFVKTVNKNCKFVSLIPGTGTDNLIKNYELRITNKIAKDFKDAVKEAIKQAKKGDTILFSPAFASFGLFNNEYERNDLFVKIIKRFK